MTICNKLGFASEALQKLCIENEMTSDLLMSTQILDVIITLLKSHPAVLHLLANRIFPETVAIFLVCLQGLLPRLGDSKAMFVSPLEMFGLHLFDDGLSLLVDMWCPPNKSWLFLEVI